MQLWTAFFGILALVALAAAQVADNALVTAVASFPEDNPFGQIVNGERNRVQVLVENNSDLNVTLLAIGGSFHDIQTDALVKNVTSLPYGLRLISGAKLQLPYQFNSEFRPGDIRLNIWLSYSAEGELHQVTAYDSVVTVVEPEVSFLDYQVISTYLLTAAFLGGLGYYAFITFVPKAKKVRKPVTASGGKSAISSPVGTVTGSGAGGYEEEWIPEHHLKARSGKKKAGAASSGDELSGGELSASETKKRKGKK